MRLIKPSTEIIPQAPGLEGIYQQIEKAGRVCYKSEDKITEDSAKEFADRMIKSGHEAMLEHGTVYLYLPPEAPVTGYKYRDNAYSKYLEIREREKSAPRVHKYITTNFRVMVENRWLNDLGYLCEPTEYHEKRITVKFTTQVAVSREFNRHKVNSMAEQSTSYCNYTSDKFGGVGVNIPSWIEEEELSSLKGLGEYCEAVLYHTDEETFTAIDYWLFANLACEYSYENLIRLGWSPKKARTILPLDTNTELYHTAFLSDWKHFFELRCAKNAHPDAQVLANELKKQFIEKGWKS